MAPPTDKQLANLALARARALEVRAAFASSSKEEKADILRARAEKLVKPKRVKKVASPLVQPSEESSVADDEILQPVETRQPTAPEPLPAAPEPQPTEPTAPKPATPEPDKIPKKEKCAVMRDGKRRRRIIILDSSSDDEQPPTRPLPPVADDLGIYRRLGLF
jgi:hypothetical protein